MDDECFEHRASVDSRGGTKNGVHKKTMRSKEPRDNSHAPNHREWKVVGKNGKVVTTDGRHEPRSRWDGVYSGVPVHRSDAQKHAVKEQIQPRSLVDDKLVYVSRKNRMKKKDYQTR